MKTVYCVSLEEGSMRGTGSQWFTEEAERDAWMKQDPKWKRVCIPFKLSVPNKASKAEITQRVDVAAWHKDFDE